MPLTFEYVLTRSAVKQFDAKQVFQQMMVLDPVNFTLNDLLTLGDGLDTSAFHTIMLNRLLDPNLLPNLALATKRTPGLVDLSKSIVEDILRVCSERPNDEFAAKVYKKLVDYKLIEGQMSPASKGASSHQTGVKVEINSKQHRENVNNAIDKCYQVVADISLEVGGLGEILVAKGFFSGRELRQIQQNRDQNAVPRELVEMYVRRRPGYWTMFLDALRDAHQSDVADRFAESYRSLI